MDCTANLKILWFPEINKYIHVPLVLKFRGYIKAAEMFNLIPQCARHSLPNPTGAPLMVSSNFSEKKTDLVVGKFLVFLIIGKLCLILTQLQLESHD